MHENRNSILFLINTEKLSLLSMIQLLWIGLNDLYPIFFFFFLVWIQTVRLEENQALIHRWSQKYIIFVSESLSLIFDQT